MNNQHLYEYALILADSSLIMGQRLSEWTGHGPMLEQDIALTNITLDLIGQSRLLYQVAARLKNADSGMETVTEDTLAFLRDAHEYKNVLIAELPNGDWGRTVLKVFFFARWQLVLYNRLQAARDKELAAIAEKSLKEVAYHTRWSEDWVKRLGDGTQESHDRMQTSLDDLWIYTGEFFQPEAFEAEILNASAIASDEMKADWKRQVIDVLKESALAVPDEDAWMHSGGKKGRHTEHLGYILAEMQYLQRAYPGCEW